jgi:hypothetical protein
MGYTAREQRLDSGYLYCTRRVDGDVWGRDTELKIRVQTGGATGANQLDVEAAICPGGIPQASYDPKWILGTFNETFE